MKPTAVIAGAVLVALMFLVPAAPGRAATGPALHFDLAGSLPADSATVQAPSEVRLWFTEVPADGTVTIRVVDASGTPIHTGAVSQDEEDRRVVRVALHGTLAPGRYTVPWRGMAADGHVVRGELTFFVATP